MVRIKCTKAIYRSRNREGKQVPNYSRDRATESLKNPKPVLLSGKDPMQQGNIKDVPDNRYTRNKETSVDGRSQLLLSLKESEHQKFSSTSCSFLILCQIFTCSTSRLAVQRFDQKLKGCNSSLATEQIEACLFMKMHEFLSLQLDQVTALMSIKAAGCAVFVKFC